MVNYLPNEEIQIKLIDFGMSRHTNLIMTPAMCTYKWMAPEMTNKHHYDEKCDVYSYGVVLHELLYGRTPFKCWDLNQLFEEKKTLNLSYEALSKET
jgi:serine/threonine protein kinase